MVSQQNAVYVLGVNYLVVDTIHWTVAVTRILEGRMSPFKVHPTERIRSAGGTVDMARPLIVRLNYWAPQGPRKVIDLESRASREEILRRDGRTCAYCGAKANTVDHVIPESRCKKEKAPHNGWTWGNLVSACFECNQFKADRTPEEAGMKLLWSPHTNSDRYAGVQEEVWRILNDPNGTGGYHDAPTPLQGNRKVK